MFGLMPEWGCRTLFDVAVAVRMEAAQEVGDGHPALSGYLGWPQEAALVYALRLVNACIREGLIGDVPGRAFPGQAAPKRDTGGKVLAFPARKAKDGDGD